LSAGAILGLFIMAILSAGAVADEKNDQMLKILIQQDADQNIST
jgi:hypothetical protein